LAPEAQTGARENANQKGGNWWFSQVIGDDPESGKTHLASMEIDQEEKPSKKHPQGQTIHRLYGAAFDIVLTSVPVHQLLDAQGRPVPENPTTLGNANRGKGRPQFYSYVTALRDSGFVTWHRWYGNSTKENEIHSIDVASPILDNSSDKHYLRRQVNGYLAGLPNVLPKPGQKNKGGYRLDFPITSDQKEIASERMGEVAAYYSTLYPNVHQAPAH